MGRCNREPNLISPRYATNQEAREKKKHLWLDSDSKKWNLRHQR